MNRNDTIGDVMVTGALRDYMRLTDKVELKGKFLRAAELTKRLKYGKSAEVAGLHFVPYIFETGGRWNEEVNKFLQNCAKIISERSSLRYSNVLYHLTVDLAVIVNSSVVSCITDRADLTNSLWKGTSRYKRKEFVERVELRIY